MQQFLGFLADRLRAKAAIRRNRALKRTAKETEMREEMSRLEREDSEEARNARSLHFGPHVTK
jgi:hypothetical protein